MKITNTIHIDAPLEIVWQSLADLGNISTWANNIATSQYEMMSEDHIGSRRVCEINGMGTLVEEIQTWEEKKGFSYKLIGIPMINEGVNSWQIEEAKGGTKLSLTSDIKMKYGAIGRLIGKLMMRGRSGGSFGSMLEEFKHYVENGSPLSTP